MNYINKIINILKQIEIILKKCYETNWLPSIEAFIYQLSSCNKNDNQLAILRNIMGMYGGMGSFNDLVLFNDGKVYYQENEKLDLLRKDLYEICKEIIIAHSKF